MRKIVDIQVNNLIENAFKNRHRSLLIIIGDRGRYQIVNLHYILCKIWTRKPSVLWCYKKELDFSSHRRKRMRQIKRKIQRGYFDPNVDDPFELFVSSTKIRYCYYKETDRILGQTYGMCILQDFEALTPNILCRALETVEGGGLICILLGKLSNLEQLYSMTMDSHIDRSSLFGKERNMVINLNVEPLFNERFILSLTDCSNCLVVDDELNILSINSKNNSIQSIEKTKDHTVFSNDLADNVDYINSVKSNKDSNPTNFSLTIKSKNSQLEDLQNKLKNLIPAGPLIYLSVTLDQAECLLNLIEIIADKKLSTTVSLTSGRGRGKSATLGLAIAAAIAYSYSNIFITAPSPENVGTIFEFIQKGLLALGYNEHEHFELIQGNVIYGKNNSEYTTTNPQSNLVRINVFKDNRQTIQYITPTDIAYAKQSEFLIIDEAAAIPLPIVSNLLGNYLVFLSSTVNGYEGTGRSLSLKLIKDLKNRSTPNPVVMKSNEKTTVSSTSRSFKELELVTPIRYNANDPIEEWLHKLLCLDMTTCPPLNCSSLPPVQHCRLYEVNRHALFSYHKASELFLHKLVSLFISSHYKNSPNDILLLSDAPAHHIFVLLPPLNDLDENVPDILAAVHVCFEGSYTRDCIREGLQKGIKTTGDLLPWTLSQSFIDEDFGSLNGLRIMRIAVHPSIQNLGYGTETMRQLINFITKNNSKCDVIKLESDFRETLHNDNTKKASIDEMNLNHLDKQSDIDSADTNLPNTAAYEMNKIKKSPPLLDICEHKSFNYYIDYIGVAFGVTLELLKFYMRLDFEPVYLRQTPNKITGEYSVILLRPLTKQNDWLPGFVKDFKKRFCSLIRSHFSNLSLLITLYLLLDKKAMQSEVTENTNTIFPSLDYKSLLYFITNHDILRLERFKQQIIDRNIIYDMVPTLSYLLFTDRFVGIEFSILQYAVLLGFGLQSKTFSEIATELGISDNQVVTLFNKSIYKIYGFIRDIQTRNVESEMRNEEFHSQIRNLNEQKILKLPDKIPEKSLDQDINEAALAEGNEIINKNPKNIKNIDESILKRYSMDRIDENALLNSLKTKKKIGTVSLKVDRPVKSKLFLINKSKKLKNIKSLKKKKY